MKAVKVFIEFFDDDVKPSCNVGFRSDDQIVMITGGQMWPSHFDLANAIIRLIKERRDVYPPGRLTTGGWEPINFACKICGNRAEQRTDDHRVWRCDQCKMETASVSIYFEPADFPSTSKVTLPENHDTPNRS